jgi:predicted enzyme related to lactoylglutathione lyase
MTVWALFPAETGYFAPSTKPFMLNYRVRNLDETLAALKAEGVQVDDRVEDYPYGRFGWMTDPEGNRIELWEPRDPAPESA